MNTPEQIIKFVTSLLEKQRDAKRAEILQELTATFCVSCGRKHAECSSGHCQCERDE